MVVRALTRWLLLPAAAPVVRSAYYPTADLRSSWQAPILQPWEPLRATATSITVAWTTAWNAWCNIDRYELESRRPGGDPLHFADLLGLQFRELDLENESWPGDEHWTAWEEAYHGLGRVYTKRIEAGTGYAAQFRVRACGKCGATFTDSCSPWSQPQIGHTILNATMDKVNIHIRGMGKNAPDYALIEVNHRTIYKRRDETGLVLAAFSRLDFSLQWLRTYDTHRDRNQSLVMSRDLRRFNYSYFVVVVSTIAWEWHAPRSLVQTLEFCGAYHFGQWAHIFAEQPHYYSNFSDLQQTASQDEFGHPYAFIGIPGIGMGMGWESLMHNTGHYLASPVRAQQAVIRGIAHYDYVARLFRLQDVVATKADLYAKGQPPAPETLHNPLPKQKQSKADAVPGKKSQFKPYIGTLQKHITKLIEANLTVPPFNFAFELVSDAGVRKVDPRPRQFWVTELGRIWPQDRFVPGTSRSQKACQDFIYHNHTEASPEAGGPEGPCAEPDTPNFLAVACNIGITPTICRNVEKVMLQKESEPLASRWPYPFRLIH